MTGLRRRAEAVPAILRRHPWSVAVGVMAVMVVVFFSPVFLHGATFSDVANLQHSSHPWTTAEAPPNRLYPQLDQANFVHPRQVFVDHALKSDHQVPLWNPQMFGGHPFMADGGSRLAYPPLVVLSLLFDPSWTHDLYVMLHLFVAGIAVFALMRELKVGVAGSLLAGVAWAFGSYTLGWVMLEMFAAPAALLPLALLCVRRWHDRRSWPALLVGALVLGFLFLGTSLELALLSFLCVGAYAGCLALTRVVTEWRDLTVAQRLALLAAPVVMVVGALAVAAVGVLPFVDLARQSERAVRSELSRALSVVPVRNFRSAFSSPPVPLEVFQAAYAVVTTPLFVGTATAVLAVVGLFLRRPGSGLGRALVVGLFLFTVGTPFTWLALHVVPGLSALRGYGRALFLWDLGLAVLGGLGLDAVIRWFGRRPLAGESSRSNWVWRAMPGVLAAVCIVATAAQLMIHGRRVNPPFQSRQAADLYPSTPAIEAVRSAIGASPGRARVLPLHWAGDALPVMHGAIGMSLDLPVASGYEPVVPAGVSRLSRVLAGEPVATVLAKPLPGTFFPYFGAAGVRIDLLGRAGVGAVLGPPGLANDPAWTPAVAAARGLRQTYAGPDGIVYEVADRPPRASVVTDAVRVLSSDEALERFVDPTFDPRRQVILQGAPSPAGAASGRPGSAEPPAAEPTGAPAPQVEWVDDRPNYLRLRVTSPAPGWLVLLDSFDPGWHATVDGHPTEVVRADYNFRAVRVPAGTSTVGFSYRPTSIVAGAWISALSIAVILGLLLLSRIRSSRRGASGGGPAPEQPAEERIAPTLTGG